MTALDNDDKPGAPSPFGCPACGGVLWEMREGEGDLARYRCRVGHAYGSESLLAAQSGAMEDALWSALRALEESESLARRLAAQAHERNLSQAVARFDGQARDAQRRAAVIRQVLAHGSPAVDVDAGGAPSSMSATG